MKKLTILFLLLLSLLLAGGALVSAQDGPPSPPQGYRLLAPLPGTSLGPNAPVNPNALAGYLQTLFNIGVGVAIALAVIMIVIGGAQYLSTDAVSGKQEGIGKLKSAVTGLILALGIYLILAEVNPDILKLNLTVGKLEQTKLQEIAITNNRNPAEEGVSMVDSRMTIILKDEEQIRKRLEDGGLRINKRACQNTKDSNCTNVGGLPETAISRLFSIQADCPACFLRITGGTEYWLHTARTRHGPGNAVVDLEPTTSLNVYLLGTNSSPASGTKIEKNGALFTFENKGDNSAATGPHWHVVLNYR